MQSVEAPPSIPSIVSTVGNEGPFTIVQDDCGQCRFWNEVERRKAGAIGQCRRHPPRIFPPAEGVNLPFDSTFFPEVEAHDWCGEFEVRK